MTDGIVTRLRISPWAAAAFTVYVLGIVMSNYAITHWGTPAVGGTHTIPVWPGLSAPSGVLFAALTFPARDVLQRAGGRGWGILAIAIGAGVAWLVSSPTVAAASAYTYLCSETLDFGTYTVLQRRWYKTAITVSVLLALVADSVLFVWFLHLTTGYPADWGSVKGLIVGKFWVACIAVPVVWTLKRVGPVAAAPQPEANPA